MLDQEKARIIVPYFTRIYLSNAIDSKVLPFEGNYIKIVDASDAQANIKIRLDSPAGPQFTLRFGSELHGSFQTIYMDASAQANKWIDIAVSKNQDFEGFKFLNQSPLNTFDTPPLGATEITARVIAASASANPQAMYTVTAGKTFFLKRANVAACQGTGSTFTSGEIRWTDSGGTLKHIILIHGSRSSGCTAGMSAEFQTPFMIPSGEKIELNCFLAGGGGTTGTDRIASVYGWEI